VKDGMQRTQQLRGLFVSHFGKPSKTLLMGHSLGGLVALGLAERFPEHYAGALVMCGLTAGSKETVAYLANIRVLFDFFYPGALPGNLLSMPAGTTPVEIQGRAIAAMTGNLAGGSLNGALAIASIMDGEGTPIPFIQVAGQGTLVQTLVGSIVYALSFHARGFDDLIDRTYGDSPFDNMQTVYTSSVLPAGLVAAVNAGVGRFSSTPNAQEYLRRYYEPTGALQIPVVTLNNGFDPIAPAFQARSYREATAAAGASALLTERVTTNPFAYGHCAIPLGDTMAAFADLLSRGSRGQTP